jgi:hypothetical protein
MEQKVSVWKANLTNGMIMASISIVYSLIMYFLDLYLNKVQGFIFLPVLAVITFLLLKSYRDNYLHGQMTYGQSFGAGMVLYLYYAIVMAVFTYILYAIIDPGLVDKQLAMAEEMMVKRGSPEAAIEAGMSIQKKIMKPEILAPLSIFGTMLWGLLISLIISVFVRKEGNPLIDTPEN